MMLIDKILLMYIKNHLNRVMDLHFIKITMNIKKDNINLRNIVMKYC